MEKVYTKNAPEAIGPYSQAVKAGGLLFTSGQIPLIPETGELAQGDIAAQAEQSCQERGRHSGGGGLQAHRRGKDHLLSGGHGRLPPL